MTSVMTPIRRSGVSSAPVVSYAAITTIQSSVASFETASLFDEAYVETILSPIDQFIENANAVNLLYLRMTSVPHALGRLALLGYMSAVESYLRAVLRGIVNLDEYAARLVEPMSIPYGAALHLKQGMLAEALLEEFSFAGSDNVKEAIKLFAGVKGQRPAEVDKVLGEYQKICEMRHCCVHRFGKLGAKNAIRLGLASHGKRLEKPLVLSQQALENIALTLRSFVKVINNHLFRSIMERTVINKNDSGTEKLYRRDWVWVYKTDRPRFIRYYKLFATVKDSNVSPPASDLYASLKTFSQARVAPRPRTESGLPSSG